MKRFFVLALLIAFAAGTAKAGSTSSLAFVDMGTTSVNTGDINTATTFTFGNLMTTSNASGIFAGPPALPDQHFGAPSFSLAVATNTSFSISSTAFGSFRSTSISETMNTPGFVVVDIVGNYTGGQFDPTIGTSPASLILTFSQDPAHTGVISSSGIFSASPQTPGDPPSVPEPSTVVMGLTSIVAGGLFYLRRRRRFTKAIA
jgi:hypothetical protein